MAEQQSLPPGQGGLDSQEAGDLGDAVDLMAALKRAKGQPDTKWTGLAEASRKLTEPAIKPEVPIRVPKFDPQTGEKLETVEAQLAVFQRTHPDISVPKFDGKDGHQLTPAEQVVALQQRYS